MSDERPLSEDARRMRELIREVMGDRVDQPFVPFAIYRKDLDRVDVVLRDCSVCELHVGGLLILLQANHPKEGDELFVGFAVECVSLLQRRHFPTEMEKIELGQLLEAILFEDREQLPFIELARKLADRVGNNVVSFR
jgi:hypothetical protein